MKFLKKFVGTKAFYITVLSVVMPMVIQNMITSLVSLLDNIMVGRLGTELMSSVSIANQLMFVFNLAIFGAISGAGIFCAQFYGKGDLEGVRHTMKYKLYITVTLLVIFIFVAVFKGSNLIALFLTDTQEGFDISLTLSEGMKYLYISLLGLIPFVVSQAYSSTLRETGETVVPMKAGIVAVFVNMALNYVLIFEHFGYFGFGVAGAAAATVISRYVECLIIIVTAHKHTEKYPFIVGVFKNLRIPFALAKTITIKGTPLMMNEFLWSLGLSAITQSYSTRGLAAIASLNIASVVENLFNIFYFAIGSAIAIIVGQKLGAGKTEEAKDSNTKLIAFAVAVSTVIGIVAFVVAPLIPLIYNTTDEVRSITCNLLRIKAAFMPLQALLHCCYFTIRSGGKTGITFLFDCVFICCVSYPASFVLARFTVLPLLVIYTLVTSIDVIKAVIGVALVKKGIWINNLVSEE